MENILSEAMNNPENQDADIQNICKPEAIVTEFPHLFSNSQINWIVKSRRKNGLLTSGAVLQVGRRVYLHKQKFLIWFLSQRG
jgi:hypothetical protein